MTISPAAARPPDAPRSMAHFMDGLVSEARGSRDAAFNALDSVGREAKRATATLAVQVDRFVQVHEAGLAQILRTEIPRLLAEQQGDVGGGAPVPGSRPDERDTRFDPEDEWDVVGPTAAGPTTTPATTSGADEDDDDYPQTWLR